MPRGGGSPYAQHTTGMPLDRMSLRKFCLTKRVHFSHFALQKGPHLTIKGPFQLKIKFSPPKNALFANLKCKNFLNSAKSYVLKHFLPTFSQICLTKG